DDGDATREICQPLAVEDENGEEPVDTLESVQTICETATQITLDPGGALVRSFPFVEGEGFRSIQGRDAVAGNAFTFEITEERAVLWEIRTDVPVGFHVYTYESEGGGLCDGHFGGSVATAVPVNGYYEVAYGKNEAPFTPGKYTVIVSS